MGGDLAVVLGEELLSVSIHAPAWGATRDAGDLSSPSMFQSTPPHGGRLKEEVHVLLPCVSIHAPAWGATYKGTAYCVVGKVSIHAPAWGATLLTTTSKWKTEFQSTPPHGGRPADIEGILIDAWFQSTPPHGGRRNRDDYTSLHKCFNPRPRMGGD